MQDLRCRAPHLEKQSCQLLSDALEDQVELTNGADDHAKGDEHHVGSVGL